MKAKRILIFLLIAVVGLGMIYLLLNKTMGFEIKLNIIKYHTFTEGDKTFKFYGSGGEVRRMKIKDGATGRSYRVNYIADSGLFDAEMPDFVLYEDINFDGMDDLLIMCAADEDNDIHYSVYIFNANKKKYQVPSNSGGEEVICVANFTIDKENKALFSEETTVFKIKATNMDAYLDNEKRTTHFEYRFIDGIFTTYREQRLSYYYQTDYCAYAVYEYDETEKSLIYKDEKWFETDDSHKYLFD